MARSFGSSSRPRKPRGNIETLPSGARRVRVYAGKDPLTGLRHDLKEVVPAGPDADKRAEQTLVRLLDDFNEQRHPRTDATVQQLLDKHLP